MKSFKVLALVLMALNLSGAAPVHITAAGPSVRQVVASGVPDFYANVQVIGQTAIISQGATEYCALYAAVGAVRLTEANAIHPYNADELAREYARRWPGDGWANVPNVAALLGEKGIGSEGVNFLLRHGRWCDCDFGTFVAQSRAWLRANFYKGRGGTLYPWVTSKGAYHAIVALYFKNGWLYFADPLDGLLKRVHEDVLWKTVIGPNEWDGGWLVGFWRM